MGHITHLSNMGHSGKYMYSVLILYAPTKKHIVVFLILTLKYITECSPEFADRQVISWSGCKKYPNGCSRQHFNICRECLKNKICLTRIPIHLHVPEKLYSLHMYKA